MQTVTTIGLDIAKSFSSPRHRRGRWGGHPPETGVPRSTAYLLISSAQNDVRRHNRVGTRKDADAAESRRVRATAYS